MELTTSNGLKKQTIIVLAKKRYVVLETGEIKDFDTSAKNRADNIKVVKTTMRKLRRLIAHNFNGGNNQLWITLTYREHVTDYKIASRDYKIFMKNLRRKYDELEYISVIELQANGRWHFHVLLRGSSLLFISNKNIERAWGRGFTKTKRLKSSDKVGNYVIAYLSDLDLPTSDSATEKKLVKGARLYLYPKGIRIYRRSKGINDPVTMTGRKKTILEENNIYKREQPNFSKQTTHRTKDGKEITYITEFYDNIDSKKAPIINPTKAFDDKHIDT